jgi:hypothetical protein
MVWSASSARAKTFGGIKEQLEERRRKAEDKKKEDKKRREVEKQRLEEEKRRKRRKEVDAATLAFNSLRLARSSFSFLANF